MSALRNMTDRSKTHERAVALIGDSITFLSVLVIGNPLAPAMIRTLLLGWILILLGHRFHTAGFAVNESAVFRVRRNSKLAQRMLERF
jgi:uncharacterized membrane protein HdeD (DUF308 family)